jgi:predicted RNA-binding protein YlxR (DUF448 family)
VETDEPMLARVHQDETDAGPRSAGVTERLCAVTRQVRPIDELIRFVLAPDGTVVADIKRRLPGRGVWVGAERKLVAQAVKRQVFSRALRADAKVPPDLPDLVEAQLERAVLDALAIAHKAGAVVTGFVKVEATAHRGGAIAYLHAAEGGADGRRKIAAARRRGEAGGPGSAAEIVLSSTQLDLALGRPNVVHAALTAGRASDTFLARRLTLERYRTGEPGDRDGGREQLHHDAPTLGSE